MISLQRALVDYEPDLLEVIATRWDVDLPTADIDALSAAMLDVERAEQTWATLSSAAQAALAVMLAQDGRLTLPQMTQRFGELRQMGVARREREKPWLNPISVTEELVYAGFIIKVFDQTPEGARAYYAIPSDMQPLLPQPINLSASTEPGQPALPRHPVDDTLSAVDDMTTLLAYARIQPPKIASWLEPNASVIVDRYLRRREDRAYRALLAQLAVDLHLLTETTGGRVEVNSDSARPWLEAPRLHQARLLLEVWLTSGWNDLAHVPSLQAETWPNRPRLARQQALESLAAVPLDTWWNTDSFIQYMHDVVPDFMRTMVDYGTWQILDRQSGRLLLGEDEWLFVEGALLRFIISGPLNWLGALHAIDGAFRLTALGAAMLEQVVWPSQEDRLDLPSINADLTIEVPVGFSRFDRLQIARFTAWHRSPDICVVERATYQYRLTTQSLQRVEREGLSITSQVIPYLSRVCGGALPTQAGEALTRWAASKSTPTLQADFRLTIPSAEVAAELKRSRHVGRFLKRQAGSQAFWIQQAELATVRDALLREGWMAHVEIEADNAPL
ncbi:MAG: hypothetical protein GYB68_09385 [Chloroflexi bacterium]|nr:hypothetical protein [Chloroflexota bacterium]